MKVIKKLNINNNKMTTKIKNENYSRHKFQVLNKKNLNQLRGGDFNENKAEWELIYIDGKPYLVRRNNSGQVVETKHFF